MSWLIPRVIEKHLGQIDLHSCTIEAQTFVLPEDVTLHGLELKFEHADQEHDFRIEKLTLYNIMTFWKERENIELLIEGVSGSRGMLNLDSFNIKGVMLFRQAKLSRTEGIFAGKVLEFSPYFIQNVQGRFRYGRKKLQIFELKSLALGGDLKGQITFEGIPQRVNYVCWLEVYDLAAQQLGSINKPLLGHLEGRVDGTIRVLGDLSRVDLFSMNLEFDGGGTIKAPLVEKVMAAPKHKVMKNELKVFRTLEGHLQVPSASLRVQNTNDYRLSIQYSIEDASRQFNLKVDQDFYFSEGIKSLLFPFGVDTY